MQTKSATQATRTNKLLLLTIFNHASWSTLHVAARYLQVYAEPTFDSQTLLSSCKGSAAIFLYLIGIINSWCSDDDTIPSNLSSMNTSLSTSTACLVDDKDEDDPLLSDGSIRDTDESIISNNDNKLQSTYQQSSSLLPVKSEQNHDRNQTSEPLDIDSELWRQKIKYTLLFAFVSTTRASSNIASSKYYPYNISEFHIGLVILLMCLLDAYLYTSLFLIILLLLLLLSTHIKLDTNYHCLVG